MYTNPLKSFLFNMPGNWICQKTLYCIKNSEIRSHQIKININTLTNNSNNNEETIIQHYYQYSILNKNIIYKYIQDKDQFNIKGILYRIYNNTKSEYKFELHNGYLKLQSGKDDLKYTEYMYCVNSKFIISIVVIKINQNYIAVGFNSNIKINKNN
uniref:Chromophore lyase CpcS/CpeS n=1 Tax=Riquetophycus sp. TaxID=1897556 RepID=A0A1C9C827_9FLOR|nr:hypothetical protein Riqu_054 [Riquetophycus sp.]